MRRGVRAIAVPQHPASPKPWERTADARDRRHDDAAGPQDAIQGHVPAGESRARRNRICTYLRNRGVAAIPRE
jgi:hypothetical protein